MARPVNILVSSTRQWNPGDEFIFFGVRSLIEGIFGRSLNWVLWNRNPDLFMEHWRDPRVRSDTISNSANTPNLDIIDLVVLAGTPEWTGAPVQPLYEELHSHPDVPLLAIGVGSGHDNLNLTNTEIAVLARPSTFITTRGRRLAEEVNTVLGFQKARAMPCPAVLCAPEVRKIRPENANSRDIGLIVQDDTSNLHAIDPQHLREIVETTHHAARKIDLINFYSAEFVNFSRASPSLDVRYSFDALDCLQIIGDYKCIVSTRLHGAIAAVSQGIPAFLISRGDYRLDTTQELFSEILPLLPPKAAMEAAQNVTDDQADAFAAQVEVFKANLRGEYISAITNHLTSLGLISAESNELKVQHYGVKRRSPEPTSSQSEQREDAGVTAHQDWNGSNRPSFAALNALIERLAASHQARRIVGVGEIWAALEAMRAVMLTERAEENLAQQNEIDALSAECEKLRVDAQAARQENDAIMTHNALLAGRVSELEGWPFGIRRLWRR